jgi:RNA polymerase sigma-70 factor, ECF subfamily
MDELTRLLWAAQGGDRLALAAFIRRSQAEVWRLCAYLVDRQAADDLTQEVYLRAWTALPGWRGEASARTWLLAIARRTCVQAIRRRLRHAIIPIEMAGDHQVLPDPADAVLLVQLLVGLDPLRRAAFVLTQLLGLSYAEAAQVCGCPVGTIRSRVARARAELANQLRDSGQHWRTRRCPIRPAERALRSRHCDPHLPLQNQEDTAAPTTPPD